MARVLFICHEGLTSFVRANDFRTYLIDWLGERGKHEVDSMSDRPVSRSPGVKDYDLGAIAGYDHVVSSWPGLSSQLRAEFRGREPAPEIHDFSKFSKANPRDWRKALYDYLDSCAHA